MEFVKVRGYVFLRSKEVEAIRFSYPPPGSPEYCHPEIQIDMMGGDSSVTVWADSEEELIEIFQGMKKRFPDADFGEDTFLLKN
jgi:hypothetical protein